MVIIVAGMAAICFFSYALRPATNAFAICAT
jgi:hypothetical protein